MAKKVKASAMPNTLFINNPEVLGQLVKAKRTGLGIKLADCAALCGVGINTLSRIENGHVNCTLSAVFAVLNGLGLQLSTKDLHDGTVSSNAESEWV